MSAADTQLWAVRLDDGRHVAATDHDEAEGVADDLNKIEPGSAAVTPWPGSPEGHAADLDASRELAAFIGVALAAGADGRDVADRAAAMADEATGGDV